MINKTTTRAGLLMESVQSIILKFVIAAAVPVAGTFLTFQYNMYKTQMEILSNQQQIRSEFKSFQDGITTKVDNLEVRVARLESELQTEKATSIHWDLIKRAELMWNNFAITGSMDKAFQLFAKQLALEYQMQEKAYNK